MTLAPAGGRCRSGHAGLRDTGRGIDAEHLKQIFDPFFTTPGLAQAAAAVSASNISAYNPGDLRFSAAASMLTACGRGTTFTRPLPRSPMAPAAGQRTWCASGQCRHHVSAND